MKEKMETDILTREAEKILPPEAVSLIKIEALNLHNEIATIQVKNETQYKRAVELGTANKRVLNRIEEFRKLIVKPFNDQIKNVNRMFKGIASRFEANDEKLRNAVGQYQASRVKTESIQNVQTETGRATIQERWDYEITDEKLIPREWLIPDEIKIGRAVRSGTVQEIPGVKIFKKKVTAFVVEGEKNGN